MTTCKVCGKVLWRYNKTGYCRPHWPQSGASNPFYGKTFSEEARAKIAVGGVKRHGSNNGTWGGHTQETREKQSLLAKRRILEHPELLEVLRHNGTVTASRSFRITKPQRAVQEWLDARSIPYVMNGLIQRYSYDFRLDDRKVVVEVQGTYWHADPRFYGDDRICLNERQQFKVEQDRVKKQVAEQEGYRVLYIWEHDIKRCDYAALGEVV